MRAAQRLGLGVWLAPEAEPATWIAGALVALAAVTALVVALTAAEGVRSLLGFTFPGEPQTLGAWVAILINNLRLLAAVLIGAVVAQAAQAAPPGRRLIRATSRLLDVVIGVDAAAHALLVGASVGAYGPRMVRALLPHGPVELGAYSLALALYVRARKQPLDRGRFLATAAGAGLWLAVAAGLETFVTP